MKNQQKKSFKDKNLYKEIFKNKSKCITITIRQ